MQELEVFKNAEFGTVRVIEVNNEPWFVGKDVAEALGYLEPRSAVSKKVDEDDRGVSKIETPSGLQDMTIINESGLYSLVLSSKLQSAKRFKRWITSEVIPSIRKNGGYILNQENLTREQIISNALLLAQNVIDEKDKVIEKQNERIEEMKPKEIFADAVSASKNSILIRDLAKIIKQNGVDMGGKRLFTWLRDNNYLEKTKNLPTQRAMNLGLFEVTEWTINRGNDDSFTRRTTRVTGKGQQYFINKFLGEVK